MEDLRIGARHVIPAVELTERFEPSGGPGGQHANRSATRVILAFDLGATSALDSTTKRTMIDRLGPRLQHGVLVLEVDESRSQWRNRQTARRRLRMLLETAMRPAPPPRRATLPSASVRRRRLETKRARGDVKRLRQPPEGE